MTDNRTLGPLSGYRVVEVAEWVLVPGAAGILADWGAEVIKVEHSTRGDGIRGLNADRGSVRYRHMVHNANRGKRSIGIDLATQEGRELVLRLVDESDVFITNLLPASRARLGLDVEDVRTRNPRIVYARGSGLGPRGAESESRGYDFAQYWARAGVGLVHQHPDLNYPLAGNAQFGDVLGASVLAGGVAAGLLQRDRTGVGPVVDVSLLGLGVWTISQDVIVAGAGESVTPLPATRREEMPNPLTNVFRTADDRFIAFVLLQSDRHWPEFCDRLDAPQLRFDARYADASARAANRRQLVSELDVIFAGRTLDEWRVVLSGCGFVWSVYQTAEEVFRDPQVEANDYIVPVADGEGSTAPPYLVATPVQFDERSPVPRRAPEHGEDTEAVLRDLAFDWTDIADLRDRGIVN
jgi:crotonobetainyl-CoA:carnitine CoA-transferase CaiB-like acyl-CoA transferase